jgi:hypothetical protein
MTTLLTNSVLVTRYSSLVTHLTFEDTIRNRIRETTLTEARTHADAQKVDEQDVEIFAAMLYALMRAGARREGPEGMREAFMHFAAGARWETSSDEELQLVRGALLAAMDRFALEAHALRVYFEALETAGMSEEEASERGNKVLGN